MGATAFRKRKSSRGQYAARKERRKTGHGANRSHESPPWYCFPLTASAYEHKLNAERLAEEQARRKACKERERATKIKAAEIEARRAKRDAKGYQLPSLLSIELKANGLSA